jgi:hypothetical protein
LQESCMKTEAQGSAELNQIVPDMAEYWDAPNSKMVRSFAMAASVLAGKPIGLGEHDTLTQLSAPSSSAASG